MSDSSILPPSDENFWGHGLRKHGLARCDRAWVARNRGRLDRRGRSDRYVVESGPGQATVRRPAGR